MEGSGRRRRTGNAPGKGFHADGAARRRGSNLRRAARPARHSRCNQWETPPSGPCARRLRLARRQCRPRASRRYRLALWLRPALRGGDSVGRRWIPARPWCEEQRPGGDVAGTSQWSAWRPRPPARRLPMSVYCGRAARQPEARHAGGRDCRLPSLSTQWRIGGIISIRPAPLAGFFGLTWPRIDSEIGGRLDPEVDVEVGAYSKDLRGASERAVSQGR